MEMNEASVALILRSRERCSYYTQLLADTPDFICVGCWHNGYDALLDVLLLNPNLTLVEAAIDGPGTGILLARALLKRQPGKKILLLTDSITQRTLRPASRAGIVDYLLKDDPPETVLSVLRHAQGLLHAGQQELSERFYTRNVHPEGVGDSLMYTLTVVSQLTPKELEITKGLAEGKSYAEIAHLRKASLEEIEEHGARILEKFNKKDPKTLARMLRILNIMEFFDHVL